MNNADEHTSDYTVTESLGAGNEVPSMGIPAAEAEIARLKELVDAESLGTESLTPAEERRVSNALALGAESLCDQVPGDEASDQVLSTFDFGTAIRHLKSAAAVSRVGWNGPNQWLMLQVPDEHSKMRKPYIYISPVDGELVPWLASQTDLLAEDWYWSSIT